MKYIKKIVPKKIRMILSVFYNYWYDLKRFIKHSSAISKFDSEHKIKGRLTKTYHVIEKGLTMPETRLGFGNDNILELINLCNLYMLENYDLTALEFVHSVEMLNEYLKFHEENKYTISSSIHDKITALSVRTGIDQVAKQMNVTRSDFFNKSNAPFDEFCFSRHTIRNFISEDIPFDILHNCVELSQQTPSACNRQPNRVYIVKNKLLIKQILSMQSGNRGFGNLTNTLLILTSDISVFQDAYERNELYLNSGMFSMSIINALHFHKIGSCALNWSVSIAKHNHLRELVNIPQNETITLLLACGYVPDNFKVSISPKLPWNQVSKDIK
jgi:nitroreductase